MLTPGEKKEIITMLEQVDVKMEEQNEIIAGIMDVVESHTKIISRLEEEIKKLKKPPNRNAKSPPKISYKKSASLKRIVGQKNYPQTRVVNQIFCDMTIIFLLATEQRKM